MKKILALLMVVGFAAATALAAAQQMPREKAGEQKAPAPAKSLRGTIAQVDNNAKSLTLKDDSGKETTVFWNDTTKIDGGELKEGVTVSLETTQQDGKTLATSIKVTGAKKPY
jgi:Cu/Ag efflux protein CusF